MNGQPRWLPFAVVLAVAVGIAAAAWLFGALT